MGSAFDSRDIGLIVKDGIAMGDFVPSWAERNEDERIALAASSIANADNRIAMFV